MGAEAAELAALALPPVIDHQLVHDVSQRQLDGAHGTVGHHKRTALYPRRLQQRRRLEQPGGLDHDVGTFDAALPILGRDDRLAKVATQPLGECVTTFFPSGMDTDLLKVKQMIKQPDIPIGGAPRANVPQDPGILACQILCADCRYCAGAHVCDSACVQHRLWNPVARIEEQEHREFRRQAFLIVVDEISDHLYPGEVDGVFDRTAQDIEMTVGYSWLQMHAGLDHGLATTLAGEASLDSLKDLLVSKFQFVYVEAVEIGNVERLQRKS